MVVQPQAVYHGLFAYRSGYIVMKFTLYEEYEWLCVRLTWQRSNRQTVKGASGGGGGEIVAHCSPRLYACKCCCDESTRRIQYL